MTMKKIALAIALVLLAGCSNSVDSIHPATVYDYCRNWDAHLDQRLNAVMLCVMSNTPDCIDGEVCKVGEFVTRQCYYQAYNPERMTYDDELEAYYYIGFCALPASGYEVIADGR